MFPRRVMPPTAISPTRNALGWSLVAASVAAGAWGWSGCSQAQPAITYAGRRLPPITQSEHIRSFAGNTPPDGHQVLGVVTARCETINESAGVLASRCSASNLRRAAATRAAQVGGSGLLDVDCQREQTGREFTRQDAGLSKIDVRHRITCRATVVRGPLLAEPAPGDDAPPRDAGMAGASELDIDGAAVLVTVRRNTHAPRFAPRSPAAVG
ncbi:MAG TPA: hypothetical protein ENK23_05960, partial [Sorangium sp.]|nr:hypothetical protein [Sorangium sp.]